MFIWILSDLFRIKKEADGIKFKESSGVKWLFIVGLLFITFGIIQFIALFYFLSFNNKKTSQQNEQRIKPIYEKKQQKLYI